MQSKWIKPNILLLEYDTIAELLEATYRFSHYHEYPNWREKIFTKEDLNNHYQEVKGDPKWWTSSWAGANLRDTDLKPFIEGKYGELDELELAIVELVKDKKEPYGICLYSKEVSYVLDHEIAHSLFYLDSKYRTKCQLLVDEHKKELVQLISVLSELYDEENLVDEVHAYAGIFYPYWCQPKKINVPRQLRRDLVRLFNKHKNK